MNTNEQLDWEGNDEVLEVPVRDSLGAERPFAVISAGGATNHNITARNGGVRHQFENDVGGCSANYR